MNEGGTIGSTAAVLADIKKPALSSWRFRLIPRFESYPAVVSFVATPAGKLTNIAIFSAGLYLYRMNWWAEATVLFLGLSFFPQYRRALVLAGTMYWLFMGYWRSARFAEFFSSGPTDGSKIHMAWWAICAAALLFCVGYYKASNAIEERWANYRPLTGLLCVYFGMLVIAWYLSLEGIDRALLWGFLFLLGKYIWFLAYALADRKAAATPPIWWHLGYFHPFWGSTSTPFPKGAAYLRKVEAKSDRDLAICQIKATKLLYWVGGLIILKQIFVAFVPSLGSRRSIPKLDTILPQYDYFGIPNMTNAFEQSMNGTPYPFYLGIFALIAFFLYTTLKLAIWGHIFIAMCRMAGFNALRNTYNPLGSATIAEFWNRYYYYFKELLVDMFFYPAFLRYFKKKPKLRMFFATMSAAFFGNCIYHYLRESNRIFEAGPYQTLMEFRYYILYAFILASGIGISQFINEGKPRVRSSLNGRIISPVRVCSFYCLLSILWYQGNFEITFMDRINFALSLVGVG